MTLFYILQLKIFFFTCYNPQLNQTMYIVLMYIYFWHSRSITFFHWPNDNTVTMYHVAVIKRKRDSHGIDKLGCFFSVRVLQVIRERKSQNKNCWWSTEKTWWSHVDVLERLEVFSEEEFNALNWDGTNLVIVCRLKKKHKLSEEKSPHHCSDPGLSTNSAPTRHSSQTPMNWSLYFTKKKTKEKSTELKL